MVPREPEARAADPVGANGRRRVQFRPVKGEAIHFGERKAVAFVTFLVFGRPLQGEILQMSRSIQLKKGKFFRLLGIKGVYFLIPVLPAS